MRPKDISRENFDEDEVVNSEKKKFKSISKTLIISEVYSNCWSYKYFYSFDQIVRLIGWILRFVNNARNVDQKFSG